MLKTINDKNSVGVNISIDNNTRNVVFGFYILVTIIAFVKLITSFNKKEAL